MTNPPRFRHLPVSRLEAQRRGAFVRRVAGLFTGLALGVAVLSGCGSDGADVDCGLDACTVTFDRGVDARASILGVEARLVGVEGDVATIEVAGERLSLTVGQQATEVGGLYATVQSADEDQVVVRIGRNAG